MQLIVITSPEKMEQEQQTCCAFFDAGLQTLHLRKPGASINELRNWLLQLPVYFHSHIMLHSCHELAQEFEVKGLHFTEANRANVAATPKYKLQFSTSFHQLEEVQQPNLYFDYAFLSPIFQSISKKNHPAAFAVEELTRTLPLAQLPVLALGGITAANLPQVQQLGFAGAAVLGSVWESINPVEAFVKLQKQAKALQAK